MCESVSQWLILDVVWDVWADVTVTNIGSSMRNVS